MDQDAKADLEKENPLERHGAVDVRNTLNNRQLYFQTSLWMEPSTKFFQVAHFDRDQRLDCSDT